jgi:hypothetical protein
MDRSETKRPMFLSEAGRGVSVVWVQPLTATASAKAPVYGEILFQCNTLSPILLPAAMSRVDLCRRPPEWTAFLCSAAATHRDNKVPSEFEPPSSDWPYGNDVNQGPNSAIEVQVRPEPFVSWFGLLSPEKWQQLSPSARDSSKRMRAGHRRQPHYFFRVSTTLFVSG